MVRILLCLLLLIVAVNAWAQTDTDGRRILRVGPERVLKTPGQAAKVARNGDLILIDSGEYHGDTALWRQSGITLRGATPRPHLIADGVARQGKAIWVITGDNVEVENIEFSGTKVASHNGAGIRAEGNRLLIRKCYFHDNEMGLMSNHNPRGEIVIEDSEFAHNTTDYEQHHRLGHNIYIGRIKRFTLRNSYIHDARVGHNVKTRAAENRLYYNLVADGGLRSSYLVDIAEGGQAYLVGNLFRQGPEADNLTLISYAAEGGRDRTDQSLYLVNNTLVNDATTGTFIRNHGVAHTHLRNNLFVGPGRHFTGLASSQGDVASDAPGFVDRPGLDFHLHADSPAIDQGRDPGSSPLGIDLYPRLEYSYPTAATPRRQVGAIDAGAFEYLPRL